MLSETTVGPTDGASTIQSFYMLLDSTKLIFSAAPRNFLNFLVISASQTLLMAYLTAVRFPTSVLTAVVLCSKDFS